MSSGLRPCGLESRVMVRFLTEGRWRGIVTARAIEGSPSLLVRPVTDRSPPLLFFLFLDLCGWAARAEEDLPHPLRHGCVHPFQPGLLLQ